MNQTETKNFEDDQHSFHSLNLTTLKLEQPDSLPKNYTNICLASEQAVNYYDHIRPHSSNVINKTNTESESPMNLTAGGDVSKSKEYKYKNNLLRTSSDQQLLLLHRLNVKCLDNRLNSSDFLYPKNKKNHSKFHQSKKFPFKNTPGGNLEVDSSQVVYATRELSVLVPNPKKTTVKILPSSHCLDPYTSPKILYNNVTNISRYQTSKQMEKKQAEELIPVSPQLRHPLELYPIFNNAEEASNETLNPEISLTRFTNLNPPKINWNQINMPKKKNLYIELHKRITQLRNPDCIVSIDNTEFKCHLIVLQCYSEMLDTYGAIKKIELSPKKCGAASFAFIYKWMICKEPAYTELTQKNVLDVYIAAAYLKIPDLIDQCRTFINNEAIFQEDTAFLLYLEAKEKGQLMIQELMIPRIKNFFLLLVGSSDWLQLDLPDIKAFLKSNYIAINCEMEIFMSGLRWILHDWTNRAQYKRDIMECVYFENVAPWQLIDIKRNKKNPEFMELAADPEIARMIDDGLAYIIIKYWYKQEHEDLEHWKNILSLREPQERNWNGPDKIYYSYNEFLSYLKQYRSNYISSKYKNQSEINSTLDRRNYFYKNEDSDTSTVALQEFISNRKSMQPKKIKPTI